MSHALLPLVLGALVGSVAPQSPAPAAPSGGFVLEAVTLDSPAAAARPSCLMVRINRSRPAMHHFGGTGICGLDSEGPIVAQVWDIVPVVASDGRKAHIVRSRANGKCLVRGKQHPVLHLWNEPTDTRWCGLASADALLADGRAAWFFDDIAVEESSGRHIGTLHVETNSTWFLAFDRDEEGPAQFVEAPGLATMLRLIPVSPSR